MRYLILVAMFALAVACSGQQNMPPVETAHVNNSFHFVVAAPMEKVAPLFAPEAERSWAGPEWNPQFVYPQPGKDVEGAVFTMAHGQHNAVWVNTVFDVPGGRMQYVYVIPDALVTVIDVKVSAVDPSHTAVEVSYTRTALTAAANEHVRAMGTRDAEDGPEWQKAIEAYLEVRR